MEKHPVVSRDDWLAARRAFLAKEKAFTRERDRLNRERRALPWVKVDKDYTFDTATGHRTLPQLFGDRSQLIVSHFMFGPDWEEGCPSCSFWADGYDGVDVHLAHRDIAFVVVSRAPLDALDAYRERMGWRFTWVSSLGSEFNFDFNVSFTSDEMERGTVFYNYREDTFPSEEAPGMSVFVKDQAGDVFHTYSCFARGLDLLNCAYNLMDLTPRGRDEDDLPYTMAWLRRRDQYED